MESTNRLRRERSEIVEQMGRLLVSGSPLDLKTRAALDIAQQALKNKIDAAEAGNQSEMRDSVSRGNRVSETLTGARPFAQASETKQRRSTPEYEAEFWDHMRTGKGGDSLIQCAVNGSNPTLHTRALGGQGEADGATLVPTGFERELEIHMKAIGHMTDVCRIVRTETGNPLPWPTLDDVDNVGEFLAEGAGGTSADPVFSNVVLGSNLLSSKQVLTSIQLEQDAYTDVPAILARAFGLRIGRALEPQLVTGDGSPITGLVTGITGNGRSVTAQGANSNSDNSDDDDLNSIGTVDLANVVKACDPSYRPLASWMGNASTFDKLRGQLDKYGRPIWTAAVAASAPDTIFGFPWNWSSGYSDIGAGNISLVFGDFSHYVIRYSLGVTLFRFMELYMSNYQRGYQAAIRVDAKLLQPDAFSYLIHPAS